MSVPVGSFEIDQAMLAEVFSPCSASDLCLTSCEHTAGLVTGGLLVLLAHKNQKCSIFLDFRG